MSLRPTHTSAALEGGAGLPALREAARRRDLVQGSLLRACVRAARPWPPAVFTVRWLGEIKSRKLWCVKRRDLHAVVEPSGSPRAHAASRCTAAELPLLLNSRICSGSSRAALQGPTPHRFQPLVFTRSHQPLLPNAAEITLEDATSLGCRKGIFRYICGSREKKCRVHDCNACECRFSTRTRVSCKFF